MILRAIERCGLLVIVAATLLAGYSEVGAMVARRAANVTDLLLLFMYLEIVSMVEVYWHAGKLPVRMPLYIAMVALARHMMMEQSLPWPEVLASAIAIVLIAFAVLLVRWGHLKLPYNDGLDTRS